MASTSAWPVQRRGRKGGWRSTTEGVYKSTKRACERRMLICRQCIGCECFTLPSLFSIIHSLISIIYSLSMYLESVDSLSYPHAPQKRPNAMRYIRIRPWRVRRRAGPEYTAMSCRLCLPLPPWWQSHWRLRRENSVDRGVIEGVRRRRWYGI